MTSLCGVWWCSNTIFYGQYPTQVKEELFLNDILCLKGRSFFAVTENRRAPIPIFCQAILSHFFVYYFSVTKSISIFHAALMHDQKCTKLKSTSVQQTWTEKIWFAVPKVRFSAVSMSSWCWAVHAITDR